MLYTCWRCWRYQTPLKANLKRHMNQKNPCHISIRNQPHNETQTHHFNCKHCNETFTRKNNLNRHIRLYCKEFKLKQENVRLQEENRLLEKIISGKYFD